MAYFSNGSEGERFMARYCWRCANWREDESGSEGCPVMDLHLMWNYDAVGKNADATKRDALNHFIAGTVHEGTARCSMFQPATADQQEPT